MILGEDERVDSGQVKVPEEHQEASAATIREYSLRSLLVCCLPRLPYCQNSPGLPAHASSKAVVLRFAVVVGSVTVTLSEG